MRVASTRWFCVAILASAAVAFALLGVAGALDADEPVFWGTYEEDNCDTYARSGCRSQGTWISDDGSIRKSGIYLDGRPSADGTARASYRPTGVINDLENNIVHVEAWPGLSTVLPWVACVGALAGLALYITCWRLGLL